MVFLSWLLFVGGVVVTGESIRTRNRSFVFTGVLAIVAGTLLLVRVAA